MAYGGISNEWTSPPKWEGIPRVSTRFSLSVENEKTGRGTGRPNPSREAKFSGRNGDSEIFSFAVCAADHEQDRQPYSVDPYSDDHTYYILYLYMNTIYMNTTVLIHTINMYMNAARYI